MKNFVEYIWLDGTVPVQQMRSKSRYVPLPVNPQIENFPTWNFDASSTHQSTGGNSDYYLRPVNFVSDPFRGKGNYLVMCEVIDENGAPHASNARAMARSLLEKGGEDVQAWMGFEQEYTLFRRNIPLGWPENGYPAPQGPYYCGVGTEQIHGRDFVEDHAKACLEAGLMFYGLNAEVMPGQWEFQIGYRGDSSEDASLLTICDHLWIARWIIHRLSEVHGIHVSFENKPCKGDWNGAGMHTNFSTQDMRNPDIGMNAIQTAITRLAAKHEDHIRVYGFKLAERLTGFHETCSIDHFKSGVGDRGASVRVPHSVVKAGHGYLEDRRPGANADPYRVAARLLATICDIDDGSLNLEWLTEKH